MNKQPSLVRDFVDNRDAIWGFVYSLTRDPEAAEEVFQEVSITVLEESTGDIQVDNFLAWVREIARRRVAAHYRKKSGPRAAELSGALTEIIDQSFMENESPHDVTQDRMKALLSCLERLAGRGRQVIDGLYRDRRSIKDLAASLGWQPESVRVTLSRARRVIADCVARKLRATEGNA